MAPTKLESVRLGMALASVVRCTSNPVALVPFRLTPLMRIKILFGCTPGIAGAFTNAEAAVSCFETEAVETRSGRSPETRRGDATLASNTGAGRAGTTGPIEAGRANGVLPRSSYLNDMLSAR